METVKIDLGDGDYAIAIKSLLHRTARAVQEYYQPLMKLVGKPVLLSEVQEGKAKLLNDFEIDTLHVDNDALLDIYIKNQVTEWSFGERDIKSLADIADSKVKLLSQELNRLYQPSPLALESLPKDSS